jgi:hypothetical protein
MGRLIEFWVTVKPIARRMPSNSHVAWSLDGQSFALTWGRIRGRIIKLELLRAHASKTYQEAVFTRYGGKHAHASQRVILTLYCTGPGSIGW